MITTRSAALQARRVTRSSAAVVNTDPSRMNKRKAAAATNNHRRTAQKLKKTVPKKQSIPNPEPVLEDHATIDANRERTINNDATIKPVTSSTNKKVNQNATLKPPTFANKKSALHASKGTKISDKSSNKVTTRPTRHAQPSTKSTSIPTISATKESSINASKVKKTPINSSKKASTRPYTRQMAEVAEPNDPSVAEPARTANPGTELEHEGQVTQQVGDDYVGPSPAFNDDGLYYVAEWQMSFWAHADRSLLRDAIDHLYTWEALNHGRRREVVRCYEAIVSGLVRNHQEYLRLPLTHDVWTRTVRRGITVIDAAREWFLTL